MATPIWQDYEVNLGAVDSASYTIRTSTSAADTIYSGKAWRKPDAANCTVIINDICADYMRQELPDFSATGLNTCDTYLRTFYVFVGDTQVKQVQFTYDYSYDYELADGVAYSMAAPIDGIIDINMPLVRTMRVGSAIQHYYETDNSFDDAFDLSFDVQNPTDITITGLGNYVRVSTIYDAGHSIVIQESSGWTLYHLQKTCARYALYYVNEYGGWDSLVMQGGFKRTDNYERFEMLRGHNNSIVTTRGRHNYANEQTFAFELKTSLLTDDQASRMHHLIGSTNVYLYDMDEMMAHPVVITDSSCEYKTYSNGGNKMVQYTINVEIAKNLIRR